MAYNNNFYLFDDIDTNNYNPYGYPSCGYNGYPPRGNNCNRISPNVNGFSDEYYLDEAIHDLLILKRRGNYTRRCCNRCGRF